MQARASDVSDRKRRRRGASLVEYVSVMAIGAALLAGGGLILGDLTRATFGRLGVGIARSDRAPRDMPQSTTAPTPQAPAPAPLVPWWGVALLLGCGAVGLVIVSRRKRLALPPSTPEVETAPLVPERMEAQFIAKRQQILQVLDRELWCLFDGRIVVKDILTECPTTVRPETSLERVRAILRQERIHHVLVVDLHGQLQGVISDRDVRDAEAETAAQVMTRAPETVEPATPVAQAISMMLDRAISSLPVVEDGRVVGIVTTSDMLMTLQCCVQLLQRLATTMWQPGAGISPAWNEDSLSTAAAATTGDGTGRLFDVMQAMSASQQ